MNWQFRLDISVKFRAFGMTLLNYADHEHYDIPSEFAAVAASVGNKVLLSYANHGITASVSIVGLEVPPQ